MGSHRVDKVIDAAIDATIVTGGTAAGAGTGAVATAWIGGMGLAVMGTAFALPVVAIGAGVGLLAAGAAVFSRRYLACRVSQDPPEVSAAAGTDPAGPVVEVG